MKIAMRVALVAFAVTAAVPSQAGGRMQEPVQITDGVLTRAVQLVTGAMSIDDPARRDRYQSIKYSDGADQGAVQGIGQGTLGAEVSGQSGGSPSMATGNLGTYVTSNDASSWSVRFVDDLSVSSTSDVASASVSAGHLVTFSSLKLNRTGVLAIDYIPAVTDEDTRTGSKAGKFVDYLLISQEGVPSLFFGTVADYVAAPVTTKTFLANTAYNVFAFTDITTDYFRVGFAGADAQVIGRGSQAYRYDRSIGFSFNDVTGAVPEPATWAMMILGFGLVGATLRRRRGAQIKLPA